MRKFSIFLLSFFLVGCLTQNIVSTPKATATATKVPTFLPTKTDIPTLTVTPTVIPSLTPTATKTPLPTKNSDGTINCPGSVAFMYHQIYPQTDKNTDYLENNNDIGSFEKVINYLVVNGFYFPTPEEFASDIKTGVCRHKYAIIIIDDSWNDPETMGVTDVLIRAGGGTGEDGTPKVWFAIITRQLVFFINDNGQSIDPWEHFRDMYNKQLVYLVSHSQTHPLLIDRINVKNKVNKRVFRKIGDELLPSRKDISINMEVEPYFFVYPGGIIADPIISKISASGYTGAFTVWPGGLDGALPYYLPRINGGSRCGTSGVDNSACVIELIEKYSK